MFYRHFRFNIIFRVGIILVMTVLLAFMIQREMLFVPIAIFVVLVVAVINLIRYIEKSNKNLTHLLLSIRQGAYTETYPSGNQGKHFEELSGALNDVIGEFARLHEEKELHYQYLQALNENMSVAILSFDQDGKLLLMNPAAKRLLNFQPLTNIEQFNRIDPDLYQTIKDVKPEQKQVVRVFIGQESFHLNVQVKEILLQDKLVRIILLQNLNQELEAKEIEAWHQLMSVITHEIMNSVTPLVSLTAAIQGILYNNDGSRKVLNSLNDENVDDIYSSLVTIGSRSRGLLTFVNAYKEYAKPFEVHFETTDVVALLTRVIDLFTPDLQKYIIKLNFNYQNRYLEVKMDVALMEQVIINLIKNAMEAVAHDGSGEISIDIRRKATQQISLSVSDNGMGIDQETQRRIFIPFFTTKVKGTGIGLSLSRQIMKLHNGSIQVRSEAGKGTVFTVEWT